MNNILKRIDSKKYLILVPLFIVFYFISTISLIYAILRINNIETFLRYMVSLFLAVLLILMLLKSIKVLLRGKDLAILLFSLILIILFLIESFGCTAINKIYNSINKISKNSITYSTSLIAMKDSNIKKISDVKKLKIGIIDDENSIDGYVIAQEIIKEDKLNKNNEIIKYDTIPSMLSDLYDNKIDLIFVSSNYATMFSNMKVEEGQENKYEGIKEETVVITTKTKQVEKTGSTANSDTTLEKPFTILVMGVDSTLEDINSGSAFNGDALMLITFNPSTFNATILSIPRDTYVPIMCFKNHIENKITHAAWYGESCMISTIENFTGVNIDYYVKVNFKGVVNVVDALGGVYVDVPYSFCEQNSDRAWGSSTIYVKKGYQLLNGEKALAFSRHRHQYGDYDAPEQRIYCKGEYKDTNSNDFTRGQHQQLVIKAILNKIKDIKSLNEVYKLIDLLQKNVDTSLSTDQILSFYNIAKKMLLSNNNGNIVSFEPLYLSGYGAMIWDENMKLTLWDYIYYRGSLKEIVNAMNVNLGKKEPTLIKDFYFSINTTYEQKVIGKGSYSESGVKLIGSFVGKDKSYVLNWGTTNNVKVTVETKDTNSNYEDGEVISQNLPASYRIDHIGSAGITITVAKVVEQETTSNNKVDCSKDENSNNSTCLVPDFSKYTINMVNNWKNNLTVSLMVTVDEASALPTELDKAGTCYSDSSGKNISKLKEVEVICYEKQE